MPSGKVFLNRIAVDPVFPPPDLSQWKLNKNTYIPEKIEENNKFELILQYNYESNENESNGKL